MADDYVMHEAARWIDPTTKRYRMSYNAVRIEDDGSETPFFEMQFGDAEYASMLKVTDLQADVMKQYIQWLVDALESEGAGNALVKRLKA